MRAISFVAVMALLLIGQTQAKKDCVAGFSPYAAVPVVGDANAVTLNLFTFPVVSPVCQNFVLSQDTTTITNTKVSFVDVQGSVLVQNVGQATGTIVFTPMLSQQQGIASAKQTVSPGSYAMLSMGAVPRIETGETVHFDVSAVGQGSMFIVGGGLSGVSFSLIDQKLTTVNPGVNNITLYKEMKDNIEDTLDALRNV